MFYDNLADYALELPEAFADIVEIDAIGKTVNLQMDKLSDRIRRGVDNKSPSLADETGVARWEKILGVSTPLNSSLQARREALRAKLMSKPPINMQTLKGIIEAYMGLPVDMELNGYVIKVWYRGESRIADLKPLYATVYDTIPANLLLDIMYRWMTWGEVKEACPNWGALLDKTWEDVRRGNI